MLKYGYAKGCWTVRYLEEEHPGFWKEIFKECQGEEILKSIGEKLGLDDDQEKVWIQLDKLLFEHYKHFLKEDELTQYKIVRSHKQKSRENIMDKFVKLIGVYQVLMGIVMCLLELMVFSFENTPIETVISFLVFYSLYSCSGYLILKNNRLGLAMSVVFYGIQITAVPWHRVYHQIALLPSIYMSIGDKIEFYYSRALASYSMSSKYSSEINLVALLLFSILLIHFIAKIKNDRKESAPDC